jgi:hypothetical protein
MSTSIGAAAGRTLTGKTATSSLNNQGALARTFNHPKKESE